ncbi:hypothetical protein HOS50_gp013 [Lactobacillus phage Lenus]|uniref:Uncharacterized protein n=1 Tax=Lactobacillus phage Lenus TaxID=2053682 RepID=A0A2H4PB77_9CAUD|nr:hypothetical protein HOS50_gp013 [Lactobacillus phage Lenus]ATW59430.1 hypothetical protein [Lactobacillus phage Lenus]
MKLYILIDRSYGSYQSEFGVDGIFTSLNKAKKAEEKVMGTLPRLIDGNTEFEIKEIGPDTVLEDVWDANME